MGVHVGVVMKWWVRWQVYVEGHVWVFRPCRTYPKIRVKATGQTNVWGCAWAAAVLDCKTKNKEMCPVRHLHHASRWLSLVCTPFCPALFWCPAWVAYTASWPTWCSPRAKPRVREHACLALLTTTCMHACMYTDMHDYNPSPPCKIFQIQRCMSRFELLLEYLSTCLICRVGQNRICTPYLTVCMVISLLTIAICFIHLFIHDIYVCMYGFGQPYSFIELSRAASTPPKAHKYLHCTPPYNLSQVRGDLDLQLTACAIRSLILLKHSNFFISAGDRHTHMKYICTPCSIRGACTQTRRAGIAAVASNVVPAKKALYYTYTHRESKHCCCGLQCCAGQRGNPTSTKRSRCPGNDKLAGCGASKRCFHHDTYSPCSLALDRWECVCSKVSTALWV